MDAITAGGVGTGRDHAPAVGRSADDNRFSLQFRIVKLLDRGEKSIHINVNNLSIAVHGKELAATSGWQGWVVGQSGGSVSFYGQGLCWYSPRNLPIPYHYQIHLPPQGEK